MMRRALNWRLLLIVPLFWFGWMIRYDPKDPIETSELAHGLNDARLILASVLVFLLIGWFMHIIDAPRSRSET